MKNIVPILLMLFCLASCTEEIIIEKIIEVPIEIPVFPEINSEVDSIYNAIAESKWNTNMFLIAKIVGGENVIDQYGSNMPNCDLLNEYTPNKDMVKSYIFKYDTTNQILKGVKRYFCDTEKTDSVTWQVQLTDLRDTQEFTKHKFVIFEKVKNSNATTVFDVENFTNNVTGELLDPPTFMQLNIKYSSEQSMLNVTTYRIQLLKE